MSAPISRIFSLICSAEINISTFGLVNSDMILACDVANVLLLRRKRSLPLPLGEGRGEGLAAKSTNNLFASSKHGSLKTEGVVSWSISVNPHPIPLPKGEGDNKFLALSKSMRFAPAPMLGDTIEALRSGQLVCAG